MGLHVFFTKNSNICITYILFPFLAPYVYGKPVFVQVEAKNFHGYTVQQ